MPEVEVQVGDLVEVKTGRFIKKTAFVRDIRISDGSILLISKLNQKNIVSDRIVLFNDPSTYKMYRVAKDKVVKIIDRINHG